MIEPRCVEFSQHLAIELGVECAVLLSHISGLIDEPGCRALVIDYGISYIRITSLELSIGLPFFNERKISRMINSLERSGALKTGAFGCEKMDRAKWVGVASIKAQCNIKNKIGGEIMKKQNVLNGYYMALVDCEWQPVYIFMDDDGRQSLLMIGDERVYLKDDFDVIGEKIEVSR